MNLGEREHGAGGGWLETPVDAASGSGLGSGTGRRQPAGKAVADDALLALALGRPNELLLLLLLAFAQMPPKTPKPPFSGFGAPI